MASAVSAAPSPFWSPIATRAPSAASASALARPMPDAPPVTIATFPSNPPMSFAPIYRTDSQPENPAVHTV
jgi:hypothetical protein